VTAWPLEDLVRRAKGGDEAAFSALYDRYRTPIHRYLYRLLGDWQQAEDLAQETLLKAWSALPRATPETERLFQAWLYQIAGNLATDARRRAGVLRWERWDAYLAAPHPTQVAPDDPERDVLRAEARDAIRAVLLALPPRFRAALVLDVLMELSSAQMAPLFGVAEPTMKQLRLDARAAYRRVAAGGSTGRAGRPRDGEPFRLLAPVPTVSLARKSTRPTTLGVYVRRDGRQRPYCVVSGRRTLSAYATRAEAEAACERTRREQQGAPL